MPMTIQKNSEYVSPVEDGLPRTPDSGDSRNLESRRIRSGKSRLDSECATRCANQLFALGHREEAVRICRVLLSYDVSQSNAHVLLGRVAHAEGRYDEALREWGAALALKPTATTHHGYAMALHAKGHLARALAHYRITLELQPDHVQAHLNLAQLYMAQGLQDQAVEIYRQSLQLNQNLAEAHAGLGQILAGKNELAAAEQSYQEALRVRPDHIETLLTLGNLAREQGRFAEAVVRYEAVLKLRSGHAEARCFLGHAQISLGQIDTAIYHYRAVLQYNPGHIEAHLGLAQALEAIGMIDDAKQHNHVVRQLDPDRADAIAGAASLLEKQKRYNEAYELIRPILNSTTTSAELANGHALLVAARLARHLEDPQITARLESAMGNPRLSADIRMNLHFALGKRYDETGDVDRAFEHFARGNGMKPARFDRATIDQYYDALIEAYSADFMRTAPRATRRSARPLFIVGIPRSGTSLVEQILASHPDVAGGGELIELGRLVGELPKLQGADAPHPDGLERLEAQHLDQLADRYLLRLNEFSSTAARVTDKMPHNFQYLGLIALMFPDARIIHCRRHPMDTCLSCFIQNFGARHDYAYRLEDLAAHYRQYERLMRHWQTVVDIPILEVQYEELVAEPEQRSRELVAFADLPWDDACLAFHESKRFVATASYDQVRRPIYRNAVGRWRRYAKHLGPLWEGLGMEEMVRAEPMVESQLAKLGTES